MLSSLFEQQADGAGPGDAKEMDEQENEIDQQKQNATAESDEAAARVASLTHIWSEVGEDHSSSDVGEDEEVQPDTVVHVDIKASRFDKFLDAWRDLHDYYAAGDIPDIEQRWNAAWSEIHGRSIATARHSLHGSVHGSLHDDAPRSSAKCTRSDLQKVLTAILKLDEPILLAMFADVDEDGSGSIDREEAMAWSADWKLDAIHVELAWTRADADCSNDISMEEAVYFFECLFNASESTVDAIIREVQELDQSHQEESTDCTKRANLQSDQRERAMRRFNEGLEAIEEMDENTDGRDRLKEHIVFAKKRAERQQAMYRAHQEEWEVTYTFKSRERKRTRKY
eukprot:SAG25_NODE_220_length_11624_cov_41.246508_5_plen_341_part_00